jgi:Zn finger protein HypA/HybF involved in hydrogenase expression
MAVVPKPFKYKCQKCGYTKVVAPKSDVLTPMDVQNICPKCKTTMIVVKLNVFEKLIYCL